MLGFVDSTSLAFPSFASMTTSEYCIWYLFLIVTFENQPSVQIGMWFGGFFNTVL